MYRIRGKQILLSLYMKEVVPVELRASYQKTRYVTKRKKIEQRESLAGASIAVATILALVAANSPLSETYFKIFYEIKLFRELNIIQFVNEFLMAIFFLVAGCEIKKEMICGHLSDIKSAMFPVIAATGGVVVPALIFYLFNRGGPYMRGLGIPLSTDIAFSLAAFLLFRKYLNTSLKIFLVTLAVVDDLMSIVIIGVFYSSHMDGIALLLTLLVFFALLMLRATMTTDTIYPYLVVGVELWACTYLSGLHSCLSGVLLAMTMPATCRQKNGHLSVLEKIYNIFSPITDLAILPLFAFANAGIRFSGVADIRGHFPLMGGIVLGLVLGKPIGIIAFSFIGAKLHLLQKPKGTTWADVAKVSILAGIGFTMAIFVGEIAFAENETLVDIAKVSILIATGLTMGLGTLIMRLGQEKGKVNKSRMLLKKEIRQ